MKAQRRASTPSSWGHFPRSAKLNNPVTSATQYVGPVATTEKKRDAAYYLGRGLRRASLALPAEILVELDRRVAQVAFRSRNSVITEAIRHFLVCSDANWTCGDHQPSPPSE